MDAGKYLIILADKPSPSFGPSSSFGAGRLPMLGKKAVLHVAMEKFIRTVNGITVVVVLPKDMVQTWKEYCYGCNFIYPQIIVTAGITFFHSLRNALARIPEGALVAVHDGRCPLVSPSLIASCFEKAERFQAVVPVVPLSGSLRVAAKKISADGSSYFESRPGSLPDASLLHCAQHPQVFHSTLLKKAFMQAYDTTYVDAVSVVSTMCSVACVEGEKRNFAIASEEDLRMAAALASFFL